jgi:hypothetical protein
VNKKEVMMENHSSQEIKLMVYGTELAIPAGSQIITEINTRMI